MKNLPKHLPAARIHSHMKDDQKTKMLEGIRARKYALLFISPEAINAWCASPDSSFLKELPPIAMAVIDEVHCLSQWSHSFRPSYLRVCNILRRLHVPVLMGLTATATKDTCREVREHLGGVAVRRVVLKGCFLYSHLYRFSIYSPIVSRRSFNLQKW